MPHQYSAEKGRVSAKKKNKAKLLEEFSILNHVSEEEVTANFDKWLEAPLFGFVGRLVWQKGVDLVLEALAKFITAYGCQFYFCGFWREIF